MARGDSAGDGRPRDGVVTTAPNTVQTPVKPPATVTPPPVTTPPPKNTATATNATSIVAGSAEIPGQVNVTDYASQAALDPKSLMSPDQLLSTQVKPIDENATGTNITNSAGELQDPLSAGTSQATATNATAGQGTATNSTATNATATTATDVDPRTANTYDAATTQEQIAQNGQATAQQGTVDPNHLIDAPQLDMQGAATGTNADGSVNETGNALKEYAAQNISNIIDTSTPAGKALAEALGDGNYTDSKATLKGQLETLQSEFQDADGNPKIPGWAAGTARNVSKIAAFKGMTGTAATAAMSQALMEASIPVAQQDAQFFQTVTLQNLSNKQASTINRANVLAKFDLTNIDNRMAAAVENSKAFLQMDMANLDNRQQAELINTQARVQSILEDAKAVNAQRLFTADSQNDMDKFYDNLNASIQQFNASQLNNMSQFNTGQQNQNSQFNAGQQNQMSQFNAQQQSQTSQFNAGQQTQTSQFNASEANNIAKFNADLENNRQQFYSNMQYNVDVSNAKWRQAVTLQENSQQFEAAATDVKNLNTLSQEQLNQIWDRSDALLDYLWKSTENTADRNSALLIAKTTGQMKIDAEDKAGMGSIFGSIAGSIAGSDKFLNFLF